MDTVLIISGWAHGLDAIKPMGDALADTYDIQLMIGDQVLRNRAIPEADYIITGSMGGLLAIEHLPVHCKKLVLISSTAKFCADVDYPCGTHKKILKRMIRQMKSDPDFVLAEFFKNVHFPQRQSRQAIAVQQQEKYNTDDLIAGLDYLLTTDLREKISGINIPVLIMHGMDDRIIPVSAAEWLHAELPQSDLTVFEKAGHALPAHQFGEVIKTIANWLAH